MDKKIARFFAFATAFAGMLIVPGLPASAQTMLRVGKAQLTQFAFVPADVGIETGIFGKHGIDVQISAFGGDARMVQALTAGSIDIALGGGPALASVVRGAPMKGEIGRAHV